MPIMTQPEQKAPDTDTVYLTIRHQMKTIMFYCRETDTVHRVKMILQPLMKAAPENQKLFYGIPPNALEDGSRLSECGISALTAKAQYPAELALALRDEDGSFEMVEIVPYSSPPPLPDVMKEPQT